MDETDNAPSVEYGVRISYSDGHIEYERKDCRRAAENCVGLYNGNPASTGTAEMVARLLGAWGPVDARSIA